MSRGISKGNDWAVPLCIIVVKLFTLGVGQKKLYKKGTLGFGRKTSMLEKSTSPALFAKKWGPWSLCPKALNPSHY